jgi:CRP-like cAMP-binding protein
VTGDPDETRRVESRMALYTVPSAGPSPVIARFTALASLSDHDLDALRAAERSRQSFAPHREIVTEGMPVREAAILLSGWAFRVRQFADGRRQILGLLLPGDLIGMCRQRNPLAVTTIVALTEVTLCPAPDRGMHGGLAEAYAVSGALEEAYLYRQIARLGRLSAYERIADWLLEVRERLTAAGLANARGLPMPLTQEMLGDTLGLTSVHVNRTLQSLRHERLIEWRGGKVELLDPDALVALLNHQPVSVTSEDRRRAD